jgi:hypothetical protein
MSTSSPSKNSGQKTKNDSYAESNKPNLSSLASLLKDYEIQDTGGYITQEFQDFGYRLACELDDLKHKSLYIKMAKKESRGLLESALSYVTDAQNVQSKAKLFMWRVKQLKNEKKQADNLKKTSSKKVEEQQKTLF